MIKNKAELKINAKFNIKTSDSKISFCDDKYIPNKNLSGEVNTSKIFT